jgi:DNA-binding transcriptional MocR family regulator
MWRTRGPQARRWLRRSGSRGSCCPSTSWSLSSRPSGSRTARRRCSTSESGGLDRHLRRARARYRRRRDRLLAALPPTVTALGVAAGLHVTLALPAASPSEAELLAAARERSLALTGLGRFWHDPADRPPHLIIGYATPPDHAYPRSVELLAGLIAAAARPGS